MSTKKWILTELVKEVLEQSKALQIQTKVWALLNIYYNTETDEVGIEQTGLQASTID